jgi:hypothetical protein
MRYIAVLLIAFMISTVCKSQPSPNTPDPNTALTAKSTSAKTSQTEAPPAAQQPQTVVKPTAETAQPFPPHQLITFTAEQLDEYENKILDRAETFYNNRMTHLLWTMGILMGIGGAIVGVLIPMILEWYRKRSFEKEMSTRLQEFKKYTEKQTEKLKTELISQIDDREDKQTKAVGSNLAYLFTALGGLFRHLKGWDMVITSHLIAIRHSIDGQCTNDCLKTSHLKEVLEREEITNKLRLDTLKSADEDLEDIKVRLENIADTEQRVQAESQIKDLQMIVHALIIKKRQDGETTSPQAGPQQT